MEKNISLRFLILIVILILLNNAKGITQETPTAFLKVIKIKDQKVTVKRAGETLWQEVNKYAQLFPNDSLKIPEDAVIILGDTESKWKEYKGHKVLVVKKKDEKKSAFGRFVERLYITFVKEKDRRRYTIDAVRGTDDLLISLPDTVFAFTMPEMIHWMANEPWWTEYRINMTHNKKTVSDTIVFGNTLQLDQKAKQWTKPGYYQIKVMLPQSNYLASKMDSCVINILHGDDASNIRKKLAALKTSIDKNDNYDNYFALANFYLSQKLYLDLESTLIQMIKKFPDNLEPQLMLYAYYSSFLPPARTEQLIMHR